MLLDFGFSRKRKRPLGALTLLCFGLVCSLHAQAQVAVNATTPEGSMTIQMSGPTILFLRLRVNDADYNGEGQLFVNEQGPITLFPTPQDNDAVANINLNLNTAQRGYFRQGANTLRFVFINTDVMFDGYTVLEAAAVESIPTKAYEQVTPRANGEVSRDRRRALEIYKRLAGVTAPIDSPVLVQMERRLQANDERGAAQIATDESSFYNLVVRDFAARMSTRDTTINEPMNDFIATFIGVVRDDLDARTLLTGDHFYMGNSEVNVPSNLVADILTSNNHYQALERDNYDFASVLTRVNGQSLRLPGGGTAPHPDAAGVLTTRAFMGAHAVAGTNRRLVEFTFNQFTCYEMEEWGDATGSDVRVGRDIDRFPGGEGANYQSTCKSCHSVMDGFRGAFARYDFSDNFVKYGAFYTNGGGADRMQQNPAGIAAKMNQNANTFATGYRTTDDSWVNNARGPANLQRMGWRGVHASGSGVRQLATAVANSRAFSKCMVKRVYREVCRRPIASFEYTMVETMATEFENTGYSLKALFENMAVRPECLGVR